jgi:transposase-like protein
MDTPAARRWAPLVEKQRTSGLTIKAFAKKHGLNPGTFGWWRLRLLRDPRELLERKLLESIEHARARALAGEPPTLPDADG